MPWRIFQPCLTNKPDPRCRPGGVGKGPLQTRIPAGSVPGSSMAARKRAKTVKQHEPYKRITTPESQAFPVESQVHSHQRPAPLSWHLCLLWCLVFPEGVCTLSEPTLPPGPHQKASSGSELNPNSVHTCVIPRLSPAPTSTEA